MAGYRHLGPELLASPSAAISSSPRIHRIYLYCRRTCVEFFILLLFEANRAGAKGTSFGGID